MPSLIARKLKTMVSEPESDWELAAVAFLIAKNEYKDLDIDSQQKRFDALAEQARSTIAENASDKERLLILNRFLFTEQGFAGNEDNYADPRNSFLNDVLDRKLGIPITLSLVYMEVGRRLGLNMQGISFPGHFLVKFVTDGNEFFIDPYSAGMPIDKADLSRRLRRASSSETKRPLGEYLAGAGKKEILVRMLRNLKVIYLRTKEVDKALSTIENIFAILPNSAEELRDRGAIYEQLNCYRAAVADYRKYLDLSPEALDAPQVRVRTVELLRLVSLLN